MHFDFSGAEPAPARSLQLAQPANRHRQHHGSRLAGPASRLPPRKRASVPSADDAEPSGRTSTLYPAVHGRAGVNETGLEVSPPRQGEDVEQLREQAGKSAGREDRSRACPGVPAIRVAEMPVVLQHHLPAIGHGNPPAASALAERTESAARRRPLHDLATMSIG